LPRTTGSLESCVMPLATLNNLELLGVVVPSIEAVPHQSQRDRRPLQYGLESPKT
jgi:hypothetical protein